MRKLACVMLVIAVAGCGGGDYSSSDDNSAALAVLGATAFMNGMNQARPVMATCFRTGMMTMCQ